MVASPQDDPCDTCFLLFHPLGEASCSVLRILMQCRGEAHVMSKSEDFCEQPAKNLVSFNRHVREPSCQWTPELVKPSDDGSSAWQLYCNLTRDWSTTHLKRHICGIWENWYRRSYLPSRNRNTVVENRRTDTKGEWRWCNELEDWDWHIYTVDTMYKVDNYWESTVEHRELYSLLCGDLMGRKPKEEGVYAYV